MNPRLKTEILSAVENYLAETQSKISQKILQLEKSVETLTKSLSTWYRGDDTAEAVKVCIYKDKEEMLEMEKMKASPYFTSLFVQFENESQPKEIYISKNSFIENNIYSWISPIARMRFFDPGSASFKTPLGTWRKGTVFNKKKFLIRDGVLYDLDYHEIGQDRVNIFHQPYEGVKSFGLAEIIEKLDSFQDEIIRLDPKGSLLISGPAGSGKTTLALHKMAFLTQQMELRKLYKPARSIIFVQDESTKAYFASILPALNLAGTKITTFNEWAMNLLKLQGHKIVHDPKLDEYELLAEAKFHALRNYRKMDFKAADPYFVLESLYFDHFDEVSYEIFMQQKQAKILDRFDLTVLLRNYLLYNEPQNYDLIIVDEAENYLAQQLQIIKSFRSPITNSIIYIGDLVQQTYLFTLQKWEEIAENFVEQRHIKLPTVYRFSNKIAEYLQNKGYGQGGIATNLKDGPEVVEIDLSGHFSQQQMLTDVDNEVMKAGTNDIVGVISNDNNVLEILQSKLQQNENIHVLSIQEAQGVEFDLVVLVFKKLDNRFESREISTELSWQMQKVTNDQFFVGATRSKGQLSVIWV
jgi:DNA helicase IV